MYIFRNAFKNISSYKSRNSLMFVIIFIISLLCCISLIVWQASKKYEEINTSLMSIPVDFGLISYENVNTILLVQENMGTRLYYMMDLEQSFIRIEDIRKYIDEYGSLSAYDCVNTYLIGSNSFRSYALEQHLNLVESKIVTAFSNKQYVSIIRRNPSRYIEMGEQNQFELESGRMFVDNTSAYECMIDSQIARERGLKVGDAIQVYAEDISYNLKIVGVYTSVYVNTFGDNMKPIFYGQVMNGRDFYFPAIYVNDVFYDMIRENSALDIDVGFNVLGVSSYEAMTDFVSGDISIAYGKVFDPTSDAYECVISEYLAVKNSVKVGDEISLSGNYIDSEEHILKIVGIYGSQFYDGTNSMYLNSSLRSSEIELDKIYMSYSALSKIIEDIEDSLERPYAKQNYVKVMFRKTSDLNDFYREVTIKDFGLRKEFAVVGAGTKEYYNQLTSVKRVTSFALITFVIVLAIAIIFLIMFNAFNLRERQYEIGVLASMGMEKRKIALQFFSEIIIVVMFAALLGTIIGSLSSEKVGDYLTSQNIELKNELSISLTENFGKEVDILGFDISEDYQVNANLSLNTMLLLLGIFVIVTVLSASGTISFILSFEPIAILNDRQ